MYGQAAGLAALAAVYPPALLIAALYLNTANPRKLTGLYLTGAILITAIAGVVVLIALRAGGLSLPTNRPPRYGLRVGLGALALVAACYLTWRYRRRPRTEKTKAAKPSRISRMTAHPRPLTALLVGFALFVPGVGFIAAVQVIATSKASLPSTAAALVLVVVIDLAFAWLPLALHLIAPEASTRALKAINAWIRAHASALMITALSAIGAILVINGAIGLT
jgi:hypothetical protein